MAEADALSLVFMRAHPADAARVLETLPTPQAAEFLARVPARVSAPVMGAMLPSAAARIVEGLRDEEALALLGELATQPLVAVLRHVADPRRTRLVQGLPTAATLATRTLMGYVEDSVGALTDLDVLALPAATRVADALERVRLVASTVQRVYVVAADRRLEGWVPLSTLLRAPAGASLASLMQPPGPLLPATTPLAGAAMHPGWTRASILPVVESGDRLIGVLARETLARALRAPQQQAPQRTVAGMLARGYWDALSGAAEAMTALLPSVPPVAGKADER